jgi:SPOR domain
MAGTTQVGRPLAGPSPARPSARRRERCPECGALGEPRQLVCLSCGERLALEPKKQAGGSVVAAAAALVIVSLISLVFIAGALVGGGDKATVTAGASRAAAAPALPSGPDAAQRAAQRQARDQLAAARSGWPARQAGWTTILLGAADRGVADAYAQQLSDEGVDAGVISPQERPDLGTLWLVFYGVRQDQQTALADATRLRAHITGAYVRFIPRAPSTAAPAQPPPG